MQQPTYLSIAAFALLLLTLGSCKFDNEKPAQTEQGPPALNVCYSSLSTTQSVILYAYEKGVFKKHGLEVNLFFISGGAKATAALVSGEMDICMIAGTSVVNAAVAGLDLKIVAGLVNTYPYSLMVAPSIEKPSDLKGKSLAVSTYGGSADVTTRMILESAGLEADKDVAILSIGGQAERMAALQSGQVAGTLTSLLQTAYTKGLGFRELIKLQDQHRPYQHTAIAASHRFLQENEETALNFLAALNESILLIKNDRSEAAKALAKHLKIDYEQDSTILKNAIHELVEDFLNFPPYPSYEGVQSLLDAAKLDNPNAANTSPSQIIDTTFLKKIETTTGILKYN